MRKRNRQQTIHSQIMGGYLRVILFTCILGFMTIGLLGALYWNYQMVSKEEENRRQIQQILSAHYAWRIELGDALQSGTEFSGSLDPTTCSFGKWIQQNTDETQKDPTAAALVREIEGPHSEMHTTAEEVLEMYADDPETAYQQFQEGVAPRTDDVIACLGDLDDYYTQQADQANTAFQRLLVTILLLIILSAAGIVIYSIRYADRLASRISRPVVRMAQWANRLALGIVELEADEEYQSMEADNHGNEISGMMRSFRTMVANIEENVRALQRIGDGDMTTFVHVHSRQDALGKSIYHLLQTTDFVFHKITDAAHTVADDSGQIANVSQQLADSSADQAAAVHELTAAIEQTSILIRNNDEQARQARKITEKIKQDTQVSNEHMKQLVESVLRIQESSQRISTVVKSIEDIAFETNILALNASIEAARAGAAGGGFAVVAEEVRSLAQKSAEAARESRILIQSSIDETAQGSVIASESAHIFDTINEAILQVVEIVERISALSDEQMEGIATVNQQSGHISKVTSSNAAISEETSAASQDMSCQAEILRKSMARFNLRERIPGQAYIPPEKRDDPAFIRAANEIYQRGMRSGQDDWEEYIDPVYEDLL